MNNYRYILEPYKGLKTRYHCPVCKQTDKTFSLYIDTETEKHLHSTVGRCNRESNCGYHYTPKQYFHDNNIVIDDKPFIPNKGSKKVITHLKEVSFIPVKVFKASLQNYESNHFISFLITLFGISVTNDLISKYFIGTSKHWNGATVFWQIDISGKVRTGKIMLYHALTGKRIKEPFNHINWAHIANKQANFELKQCLFGEHLLQQYQTMPVAIVESEKTAIIASIYLPQFIWLAAGSLTNLNAEKCKVLKDRMVILFPDLNGFEKWNKKANELSHIAKISVSDLLERKATGDERKQGFDLADYLIKHDYKTFTLSETKTIPIEQPSTVPLFVEDEKFELIDFIFNSGKRTSNNWDDEIKELEQYFKTVKIPDYPIKLNSFSTILDFTLFVESHFDTVNANIGKTAFLPYLNRLKELKQYLTSKFY